MMSVSENREMYGPQPGPKLPRRTRIINLFGGPGCGKSTTAAELFGAMKRKGYSVELVTEFAKRLVWEERLTTLHNNQAYVHGKQLHYLDNVVGKVDYVVTDSPTVLSAIYAPIGYPQSFTAFVLDIFNRYDNFNIVLKREKPYVPVGRTQTEDEAKKLDVKISDWLTFVNIPFTVIPGDEFAVRSILNAL